MAKKDETVPFHEQPNLAANVTRVQPTLTPLQHMATLLLAGGTILREDVVREAAKLLRECREWEAQEAQQQLALATGEQN